MRSDSERMKDMERTIAEMEKRDKERDKVLAAIAANSQKEAAHQNMEVGSAQFLAAIDRLVNKSTTESGMLRDTYVDPEDLLTPSVKLFTNKRNWVIEHREEAGVLIPLPDGIRGPLKWETVSQDIEKDTMRMTYRGVMLVRSKRLLVWLKKHENWGVTMFEDERIASRMDNNMEWNTFYNGFRNFVSSREESWIILEAKNLGFQTDSSITGEKYRDMVAGKMADNAVAEQNKKRDLATLQGSGADSLLKTHGAAVEA